MIFAHLTVFIPSFRRFPKIVSITWVAKSLKHWKCTSSWGIGTGYRDVFTIWSQVLKQYRLRPVSGHKKYFWVLFQISKVFKQYLFLDIIPHFCTYFYQNFHTLLPIFSRTNSRPCLDLNPGPLQSQADMLPIELSWLGF